MRCLMNVPWVSRWLEIATVPFSKGRKLSSWKPGPNANAWPVVPRRTTWLTWCLGMCKSRMGFPSKLGHGRWKSPVTKVFSQACCNNTWASLALISILNTLTAKYPPPAKRRNIRRRILIFLFNRSVDGNRKEKPRHSIRCMPGDRTVLYRWQFAQIGPAKLGIFLIQLVPLTKLQ